MGKLGDVYKINRRFHLDPETADVDKINANVADGVLEVTVQKKKIVVPDSNGPRRININTTTSTPTTVQKDDVNVDKNKNDGNEIEEAKKDHHDDHVDSKARNDKEESTAAATAAPVISPSNSGNETTKVVATNEKEKEG